MKVKYKNTNMVVDVYGVRGEKYVLRLFPDDATDTEFLIWGSGKFVWRNADLFEPAE